jgi:hypothetical protein
MPAAKLAWFVFSADTEREMRTQSGVDAGAHQVVERRQPQAFGIGQQRQVFRVRIVVADIEIEEQPAQQMPLIETWTHRFPRQQFIAVAEGWAAVGFILDVGRRAAELAEIGLPDPCKLPLTHHAVIALHQAGLDFRPVRHPRRGQTAQCRCAHDQGFIDGRREFILDQFIARRTTMLPSGVQLLYFQGCDLLLSSRILFLLTGALLLGS